MSLWNRRDYVPYSENTMPESSTSNPLEIFASCAISNISVQDTTIHTLYRPALEGASDIALVFIHGYPQTHVIWRSVFCPRLYY